MKLVAITVSVPLGVAQWANHVGKRRAEYREEKRSLHNNNLVSTPEHNIEMHILGARGESALYWFLGGWWGGAQWDVSVGRRNYSNVPDIIFGSESYDAKGIARNNLSLVVYPRGVHTNWRYVLVGVQFWPEAELLGWCYGDEILQTPLVEKVKGRGAYFISQKDLRPCSDLPLATREQRIENWNKYVQ